MSATYAKSDPGSGRRFLRAIAVGMLLFSLAFTTAHAGTPAGYAEYIVPFGENGGLNHYERVMAIVQATEDNTTIQIGSTTCWAIRP